jgi:hypothetical protein
MPHDQQAAEQTKRDRRHDEQIHRRDAIGMIADEGVPALGRRPSTPDHILGHAGLTDIDAKLEKLAVDARRAPEWICDAHLADQPAYFEWNLRPATTASRLPARVQPETRARPGSSDRACRSGSQSSRNASSHELHDLSRCRSYRERRHGAEGEQTPKKDHYRCKNRAGVAVDESGTGGARREVTHSGLLARIRRTVPDTASP